MEQVYKKPHRKRHTKPCRFFQTSRCPLSAQECDFAHVLSNQVTLSPNPCRYYAAGNCGNGARCRYRHIIEPLEAPEDSRGQSLLQQPTPPFHPNTRRIYQGSWGSHGDSFQPPMYAPETAVPYIYQSDLISPTLSGDSSMSLSTSASSSLSDEILFVTGNPKYSEHPHAYQSQVHVADEIPIAHIPPFYPSPDLYLPHTSVETIYPPIRAHTHGVYAFQPPTSTSAPSSSRPRFQYPSRKAISYKTKPCKFYKVNGTCPSGVDCTFIHSEPGQKPEIGNPQLPPKPVTQTEENKKRNFFPISWRVIGGGVLMGGRKSSESKDAGSPEPTETIETKLTDISDVDVDSPIVTTHVPPKVKIATRPRSTSIPPTPSIAHVNVETLFSAESPGVL